MEILRRLGLADELREKGLRNSHHRARWRVMGTSRKQF